MSTPMFRFNFKRLEADNSGYYHEDWRKSVPLSVIAESQKEATALAFKVSGDPLRGRGWGWRLRLIDFHRIEPATAVASHE